MKTLFKIVTLTLFIVGAVSCQDEISQTIQPPQDEILAANSATIDLVSKTVVNDGSKDNIIDKASCLSVNLPVTVMVNGLEITVNSEEDYNVIEEIFDEFDDDEDHLEIFFPIVITQSDFSQMTVNNASELDELVAQCSGENEIDDDIECIDFVYPISFSIFDAANQLTETAQVHNDEEFYNFTHQIENYHIVQINFPITMILYDGTEMQVTNMMNMQNAMHDADGMCDENDNNDHNSDDCMHCTDHQIREELLMCSWTVDRLEINNQTHTEQYANYIFTFLENGTVKVDNNGNIMEGTWSVETGQMQMGMDMDRIFVQININDLADFSFNWMLYEIDDSSNKVDFRMENNRLKLERTCMNYKMELVNTLREGSWIVANFINEGETQTSNYNDFVLNFAHDFTVTATKGNDVVSGTWTVLYDGGALKLELNFGSTSPFDELNEDWITVDLRTERVEFKHDSDDSAESKLVFERIN